MASLILGNPHLGLEVFGSPCSAVGSSDQKFTVGFGLRFYPKP